MKLIRIFCLLLICSPLHAQIITTVAGNGTFGYSGDGGPALSAQLADMYYCYPAIDNAGNIYIAQTGANTIRKIDAAGTITTIAGTPNVIGYTGDGGPAVNALLYHPNSIAIDNANNIYFGDRNGNVIRKIDPAGIITTVSGQFTTACGVGDGGSLALAQFRAISGMTFDQYNNLYISDFGCNTVRKVNSAGIITTIAGNNSYGFSGDGGPATQAQMAYPCKVAVDNAGNIYIPDAQNHRIRKVSTSGIITTIAGIGTPGYSGDGGPAVNAALYYPGSVVVDNAGNLYFGDYNHVIRKIDGSGTITTFAGNGSAGYSGDGGPAIQASMYLTEGRISIDNNNNIYFVNYQYGHVIRKISICNSAIISQHPAPVTLCNTGHAVFSITASNTTGYQWQVNTGSGWTDITDAIYTGTASGTLNITTATVSMNNYQYRCAAINICGPVYTTAATLTVTTPVTPSVLVTTQSTNICEGTTASFTASSTNGGTAPTFQWQKNGAPVGANSNAYSDNALSNGDIITCQLTSNAGCLATATAVSNPVAMTVTPNVTVSVSISPSANNICSGTPVTFASNVINGGTQPVFTWFKNNVNLFLNAPTYTDNALKNGDIIFCAVQSDLACVVSRVVPSAPVAMVVNPLVTPSVTITGPPAAACRNTLVTFTASVANGGTAPLYQWQKNGLPAGTNSPTYTDNNLNNGDLVSCMLTSNANCLTRATVSANPVKATIYPDPVIAFDKSNTICEGGTRILDAGQFSSYQWNNGSTGRTLVVDNTGTYSVTVIDQHGCTANDHVDITVVLPSPKNFLPADTAVCSYGSIVLRPRGIFSNYLWNTGTGSSSLDVSKAGKYWLQVIDNNGCQGSDSITVFPKECLTGFYIPNAFTPNNDGKNDLMKPIIGGIVTSYQFRIYNRWGQLVFTSNDHTKGWDGTFNGTKQDANTFAWICIFQLEGGSQQVKKGSFVLVR